jgi:hypothetical protein
MTITISSSSSITTTNPFTLEGKNMYNVKLFYTVPWGLITKFQDRFYCILITHTTGGNKTLFLLESFHGFAKNIGLYMHFHKKKSHSEIMDIPENACRLSPDLTDLCSECSRSLKQLKMRCILVLVRV